MRIISNPKHAIWISSNHLILCCNLQLFVGVLALDADADVDADADADVDVEMYSK